MVSEMTAPDADDAGIGAAVRSARKSAGLTLGDLAHRMGVSPSTLSRAENGKIDLSPERVALFSKVLGVDVLELRDQLGHTMARDARFGAVSGLYIDNGPRSWRDYPPLRLEPVLQAALDSFLELGFEGTSVRDLARRAGLSVPGIYHYYEKKHDLLVAIMDLTMTDFHARCAAARDEGDTALERFRNLVECYALFHTYRRELAFIGASEMRGLAPDPRRRIADVRVACERMCTTEVLALVSEGVARVKQPESASRAMVAMLVGIATWYRDNGRLRPQEIAESYVVHALDLMRIDA